MSDTEKPTPTSKPMLKSKTIIMGLVLALAPPLLLLADEVAKVLPAVLPLKWVGLATALIGVATVALRFATKLPLASRKGDGV